MACIELIKKLSNAFGPSGCEREIAQMIKKEISDIAPDAYIDRMGNLIALMRFGDISASNRARIMISAHMDEVGFMINEVKEGGLLGFDTIGGISESVLAGRRVLIHGKNGFVDGIIASKAIHHKDKNERKKAVAVDKLYIDIGAVDADEARAYVEVGDFASFSSEFYEFGDGYIKGKALDDRIGCASLIEVMRSLYANAPSESIDVFCCFTVREEISLSGAKTAAFALRPDVAIVLESTAVADIAGVDASRRVADTAKGVAVSVMDRSTIYDKELIRLALDVAEAEGVKAQLKRYVSGGNDAGSIHKVCDGVRTLALSVPTRYLHSASCVAHIDDVCSQARLCELIVRNICEV
ncbi:MAG: M42 family peptidase [Clostridia bacterium]|nr:M42 family peptidase [Clostridia bacterium]